MIKNVFEDKNYYKAMLYIAIPVSIQSLFQASLSVIDQFMIGQLGKNSIAAVGLGSRFPFIFQITLAAIASATAIFTAQFWGKKDNKNISHTIGETFIFGLFVTVIFLLISLMFSKSVLSIYTKDSEIVELGSGYLRIIAIGYVPMLITFIYSAALRSMECVKVPMYAGVFSVISNTILNYIFIFGKFGMPNMGLNGTAYATTITRFIECILILIFTCSEKYSNIFNLKKIFCISTIYMKKIFIVSAPLLINEFMWALGETAYSIIYGRIGTLQVAAMTLTYPIQSLSIGFFSGIGSAVGIMVGNKLGVGDNGAAFQYSKKFIRLGIVGGSIFGIALIACSNLYVSAFNVSSDLKNYTINILFMFSMVLWIKISNMIIGGGILRSGGETKYTMYLDMFGTWAVGVPIGFIAAFILKLPIQWVYLIISGEELIRFIIGLRLVNSKKWMKNITEGNLKGSIEQSV